MDTQTRNQIKALAAYQVAGGILGIALTAWAMYIDEIVITPLVIRLGLLATVLYIFSIVCGRMLLLNPKSGLTFSIFNQVLQVIYFSFGTIGYHYVAGLRIGVGVDMVEGWTLKFRLALSSFQFELGTDIGHKFIGINLVALFLIFWMEKLQAKTKEQHR